MSTALKDPDPKALEDRRSALEDKLAQHKQAHAPKPETSGDQTAMARGLKMASEFVAGVIVGAGLGWFIDQIAGTTPWFFIIFLMLGFAAGVLNVLRSEGMASGK